MTIDEYTFREADESDFSAIATFFKKYNYTLKDEQSIRWKYLENPAGRGRMFLMEDSKKEIKGTLGYIPHILLDPKISPTRVMESVDLFLLLRPGVNKFSRRYRALR